MRAESIVMLYLAIGLLWATCASVFAKRWNALGMALGIVIVTLAWPYFVYAGIRTLGGARGKHEKRM